MSVKINPKKGFTLTMDHPDGIIETDLVWEEIGLRSEITVSVRDSAKVPAVLSLLVQQLGGGLQVEFDQSLLTAAPGCGQPTNDIADNLRQRVGYLSRDILAIADKLGIDVPTDADTADQSFEIVRNALLQIGEQVTGALSSELKPTSPFGPGPSDPPPAIAGTPVAEAQPGEHKTPRKRRTREQIEADNAAAEAAKKPQPAPAAQVPAQPTAPNPAATADFKAEMSSIEQRQAEVSPPSPLKPEQPTLDKDAPADQLDEFTLLLSKPAMPPDMHPLDLRRPGETRFADTAYVRLFFGRCLGPEYQADPNAKPKSKFEVPPVSLTTDEGVVACVQLLWAVRERAVQRGSEIPQLEALFALGDAHDVAKIAVEKIRARRGATSRPAGQ